MKKKLNWQAFSSEKRIVIIEQVKEVISKNDGCIMNFNLFSDIALSLSIDIEENKIEQLHTALSKILTISELENQEISQTSKKEWLIFMNLSFSNGKGDLKIEIPMVPG